MEVPVRGVKRGSVAPGFARKYTGCAEHYRPDTGLYFRNLEEKIYFLPLRNPCLCLGMTVSTYNIPINDIVITPQLRNRSSKKRNVDLERRAFQEIARQMSYGTQAVLDAVCKAALLLCSADSSGVSLLREVDGEGGFTWDAMAGKMASCIGGCAPRHHSPCGYCFEQNSPQLYSHPERYFEWMKQIGMPIVEGMVIPLYGKDQKPIGTVWVVSHQEGHHFDCSDLYVMSMFANHTSAALRMQENY